MKKINKRTRKLQQSVEAYSCSCNCGHTSCTCIQGSAQMSNSSTSQGNTWSSNLVSVAQQMGTCNTILQ